MGEPVRAAHAAALPPAVRARVEKTVGTDAFLLLNIAQDPGLAGSRGFLLVAMPIAITTAGVAYTIRSRSRRRCGRGLFRAL